jgi:hypothetical protein
MLNRQKIAIEMLRLSGGSAHRLHLIKWLFLLAQETESGGGNAFYQFVPYKYGPYSFSLYHEIENLARDGLVVESPQSGRDWSLTSTGRERGATLSGPVATDVGYIMDQYGTLGTRTLIDAVYERYPWFTLLTEITGRRAVERPKIEPAVYTIGYQGLAIEGLLNRLLETGIQRVIDVRNNPTSRRYGFHRSTLSRISHYLGLEYWHLPELGIPSQYRVDLNSPEDYRALLDDYVDALLPAQSDAVKRLAREIAGTPSVLLCMEADPLSCHRSRLAAAAASLSGLPVVHLKG